MPVLDWDVQELLRREGADKALRVVREAIDRRARDVRLLLGNFASYPSAFGIVGIWHPEIATG